MEDLPDLSDLPELVLPNSTMYLDNYSYNSTMYNFTMSNLPNYNLPMYNSPMYNSPSTIINYLISENSINNLLIHLELYTEIDENLWGWSIDDMCDLTHPWKTLLYKFIELHEEGFDEIQGYLPSIVSETLDRTIEEQQLQNKHFKKITDHLNKIIKHIPRIGHNSLIENIPLIEKYAIPISHYIYAFLEDMELPPLEFRHNIKLMLAIQQYGNYLLNIQSME